MSAQPPEKLIAAVMQPYFLPYPGYWQLIEAADVFVLLDDVNFINRGFINRNSLLVDGRAFRFTLPLEKASQNRLINEIRLNFPARDRARLLATIRQAYNKAPFFDAVYPLAEEIIESDEAGLARYIENSVRLVCRYAGIHTEIRVSSEMDKDNSLKAQDRIIEICRRLKADVYLNPIGGRELYDRGIFESHGLELKFMQPVPAAYPQFKGPFVSNLSFLDALMFNGPERVQTLLKERIIHEAA